MTPEDAASALTDFLDGATRIALLTGAGVSTASGIPDYRNTDGSWKRSPPMFYQDFIGSVAAQQRYWARATLGWRQFGSREPSESHHALAKLEARGIVLKLITQNVDSLHRKAGSRDPIELHGRLDQVICLDCQQLFPREDVQARFAALNPDWMQRSAELRPDGDIALETDFSTFTLAACEHCGGRLKPDVVFFGETVPPERVSASFEAIAQADRLLVVGSSLMVYSGYRFVVAARERGLPIAILNQGKTRGDGDATLKLDADCGATLAELLKALPT